MQEWAKDYSEESEGCCLNCPNAKPGCLCYECKCKKCYWYSSAQQTLSYKGWCDKKEFLKEQKKEELKKKYEEEAEEEFRKGEILRTENKKTRKKLQDHNKIISYYTCQKCKREIVTSEERIIKKGEKPLCFLCENGL